MSTIELNNIRTAILTSNRFRKWRLHLQNELKKINQQPYENKILRHNKECK